MSSSKRIASFDIMRCLAISAVVFLHSLPLEGRGVLSGNSRIVVTLMHGAVAWCVPVFIMITGALLIPRREAFGKCISRSLRMLAVLLIFGFVMSFTQNIFETHNILKSVTNSFSEVIGGRTWDVMWYLYMLIGLYLIMPVLSSFANNSDNKTILYVIAVLLVFNSIFRLVNERAGNVIGFYLPISSIYFLYPLLGYYLFHRMEFKIPRWAVIATSVVCLAIISALAIFSDSFSEVADYYNYFSPVIVIFSCCIFLLAKDCECSNKLIKFISDNSFGIYLFHCFIIHILKTGFGIYAEDYPLFISLPLIFVVVLSASAIVSWAVRRIPFVRKKLL